MILLGWLIFSAETLSPSELLALCGRLFGVGGARLWEPMLTYELCRNLPLLLLMAVGATPLPHLLWERAEQRLPRVWALSRILLCLAAVVACTAYLVDSGYNPFLYFKF